MLKVPCSQVLKFSQPVKNHVKILISHVFSQVFIHDPWLAANTPFGTVSVSTQIVKELVAGVW